MYRLNAYDFSSFGGALEDFKSAINSFQKDLIDKSNCIQKEIISLLKEQEEINKDREAVLFELDIRDGVIRNPKNNLITDLKFYNNKLEVCSKLHSSVTKNLEKNEQKKKRLAERITEQKTCMICWEPFEHIEEMRFLACCQSVYCRDCTDRWILEEGKCALCKEEATEDSLLAVKTLSELPPEFGLNQKRLNENVLKVDNLNRGMDKFEKIYNTSIKLEEDTTDKMDYIHRIILNPEKRVLIFSNYISMYRSLENFVTAKNIQWVSLDQGNINEISKALLEYRTGKARVLMANSNIDNCGTNLENTTDIIIVHQIKKDTEKQIIARAQRPGRIGRLTIHKLYHENEFYIPNDETCGIVEPELNFQPTMFDEGGQIRADADDNTQMGIMGSSEPAPVGGSSASSSLAPSSMMTSMMG